MHDVKSKIVVFGLVPIGLALLVSLRLFALSAKNGGIQHPCGDAEMEIRWVAFVIVVVGVLVDTRMHLPLAGLSITLLGFVYLGFRDFHEAYNRSRGVPERIGLEVLEDDAISKTGESG